MVRVSWPKRVFLCVIIALVYFVAGKFGLRLALINPSASAVWPPTGISLAAFLIFGPWVWPAIFFGAFLVNVTTSGAIISSLSIALGNTLEGWLGSYLIIRFAGGRRVFHYPKGVFQFTFLAALLATAISATIGVTSLEIGRLASWHEYQAIWVSWWLGDAVGALIVTPFLLLWSEKIRWHWDGRWFLECVCLALSLLLVTELVFGGIFTPEFHHDPMTFLFIPVLVWAAFRFEERVAATVNFILSVVVIFYTIKGAGPFVHTTYRDPLLILQAFMGVIGVTTLALAAVVSELKGVASIKSEFTSIVSHELRTPLAVIKESIGLILDEVDGPLNSKQQETLEITKRNVDRLSRLINNVLDFQKLEVGRIQLQLRPHDINKLIQDTVQGFIPVAQKSGLQLTTRLSDGLPLIQFDKDQITQVLVNFLSNALKFCRQGTIIVQTTKVRHAVSVSVHDQGVGIKKEEQKKLFQSFSQISNPIGRKTGGSGLGLAICKKIVELHGGRVGVRSAHGHGSTFYFTIPCESPFPRNSQKNLLDASA